jgi:hypothetical protein
MKLELIALSLLAFASLTRVAHAQSSFGSVQADGRTTEILWEPTNAARISRDSLLMLEPGTSIRSSVLPLRALKLYDIAAIMRRGPGTSVEFAVVYLDPTGKEQRWMPAWQAPSMTRPAGTPLAPRASPYLQGFVLPAGASRARVELRIERSHERRVAPYSSWEFTRLDFVERQAVACCDRTGADLLVGGDMETPLQAGLPIGWSQWNEQPNNRIERVELPREPERKHVLRFKAGTGSLLASTLDVRVTRGTAYRVSLRARGKGDVQVVVHALMRDAPVPIRIGNALTVVHTVASTNWTQTESVWFAESPGVQAAQLVLAVTARSDLEIDAIELRPYVR